MKTEISAPARKAWMSLLAQADEADLSRLWQALGGSGAPFNLGEMTVTRCALTLTDGTVGHAYVQGRSKPKAEIAAKVDALMQTETAPDLRQAVLDPLQQIQQAQKKARAAKAAATKVEFFTMVRGED